MSRNKFEVLEVEENAQPILTITDGKVDRNDKNKWKDQSIKGNSKVQQQEKKNKGRDHSPNPSLNGSDSRKKMDKVGENLSLNKKEFDVRRVKKEVVDNANKEREAGSYKEKLNPTFLGI